MEIWELCERNFKIDIATFKLGGEAVVFKSYHSRYGDVALKTYQEAFCDDEIKLLKENVYHPNIVRIIGILTNSSTPPKWIGYIMPYMQIGSLDEIIHNKNRSYDDIYTGKQMTNWIIRICCGLSYLHSRKIIHRDIKPSNVLLGESYNDVQLSDFGISRSISSLTRGLTTGHRRGTPIYVAPEIVKSGQYNFSADIYSLSITIWEILHRRIPSNHLSKTSDGERPELNNNLSKEVSDLLTRCWDNDASKRPTIDYVHEFCRETTFSLINLENSVNECETFLQNLNVHNDESFSKTITDKIFERLKQVLPANNAESTNIHNKITVVSRAPLNDDELFSTIPFKEQIMDFSTPNPVETNSEKQTILLLGGFDGNNRLDSFLILENNEQNWKKLNIKLPYANHGHGAQFLNNHIYIFGGLNSETYKLSKSLKWEKMADMNKKRELISNSSVILNNQIWVCGGSRRSVEMYDPLTNTWKEMKQMNECRYNAAAAVVNGKIFCSGGRNNNSVECYDPSSDVWTIICSMPQQIRGHGAIEMDGNLIIMGGKSNAEVLKNVWALDKNVKWIEKSSMSIPRDRFSIAKIHDKIFACGGYKAVNNVSIFDGEVWRNGPKMPTERSCVPTVVIPIEFARSLH